MNISISGAFVQLTDAPASPIKLGDSCSFILSNEPSTCFYRYKGRIARVMSAGVGLEILDQEF